MIALQRAFLTVGGCLRSDPGRYACGGSRGAGARRRYPRGVQPDRMTQLGVAYHDRRGGLSALLGPTNLIGG